MSNLFEIVCQNLPQVIQSPVTPNNSTDTCNPTVFVDVQVVNGISADHYVQKCPTSGNTNEFWYSAIILLLKHSPFSLSVFRFLYKMWVIILHALHLQSQKFEFWKLKNIKIVKSSSFHSIFVTSTALLFVYISLVCSRFAGAVHYFLVQVVSTTSTMVLTEVYNQVSFDEPPASAFNPPAGC